MTALYIVSKSGRKSRVYAAFPCERCGDEVQMCEDFHVETRDGEFIFTHIECAKEH